MLVHLDATQELVRSRLEKAARRAEVERLIAETAEPFESPVIVTGGSRGLRLV